MGDEAPAAPTRDDVPRGYFQQTRWSLVVRAQSNDSVDDGDAMEALSDLCTIYWYPLYAYCRRRGWVAEEAKDLTQGFFEKLIRGDYFSKADPEKGKLRGFLIVAFKRFIAQEQRRARRQKRGGGKVHVPIDQDWAEDRYAFEPSDELTPERLYERQWAKTVLQGALSELERHYRDAGKGALYDALHFTISSAAGRASYASVAEKVGMTESATKVAAHRLRKRYGKILRQHIADTLAPTDEMENEIEDEIDYLMNLF